jgi:hypothetical protein
MFIKTRAIVVIVLAVFLAMVAEWYYVALITKVNTLREYHARYDVGVGEPYKELVHQLRTLYDRGQTDKLGKALRGADKQSSNIYNFWRADNADAHASSIFKILD